MDKKLSEKFEEDFGSKTDYFNHRGGLFEEIKSWLDENARLKRKPLSEQEVQQLRSRAKIYYEETGKYLEIGEIEIPKKPFK